jgi:hypothetical protein
MIRVTGFFSSSHFLLFFGAPAAGLTAYLTFLLAYDLGGTRFFSTYLIGMWSGIIITITIVLERSGYARNFEGWQLPSRRILVLPLAFLLVTGILLALFYAGGAFH